MSNNFKREARYVVLKNADIMQCLTVNELIELRRIQAKAVAHRAKLGKPWLDCVVVESDWCLESIMEMRRELCAPEEATLAATLKLEGK
jgi:hypothetical protein